MAAAAAAAALVTGASASLARVTALALPSPIPTDSPRALDPGYYAPTGFSPAVGVHLTTSGWTGFQSSPSSWRLTRGAGGGADAPAVTFEGLSMPAQRALRVAGSALGLGGAVTHRIALAGFAGWRVDGTAAKAIRTGGARIAPGDTVRVMALQVSRAALVVVVKARPKTFRAFARKLTQVLGSLRPASAYGLEFKVYAGYYDTHHAANPKPKPDPWQGSPNVVFAGQPDSASGGWDTSTVRIDNLGARPLRNVRVTVTIDKKLYNYWGTHTLAPGQTLIVAQTASENFDGSDQANSAGCYGCDGELCSTVVSHAIPIVRVTIDGRTTAFKDRGQVLNTQGVDSAGCPDTGSRQTRNDESEAWQELPDG